MGHGCAGTCEILVLKNANSSNVFTWASFRPLHFTRKCTKGTQGKQAGCWPYWTDVNSQFFARFQAHPSDSWSLKKPFPPFPSTYLVPCSSCNWIPWIWKTTKPNPISFAIEVTLLPWARETCPKVITKPSQQHRKAWVGKDIKDPMLMLIIKYFVSQRFWLTEGWDLTRWDGLVLLLPCSAAKL